MKRRLDKKDGLEVGLEFPYHQPQFIMPSHSSTKPFRLPLVCEQALLERFLKAEAMALWAVRSAQWQDLPVNVKAFLERHEADEQDHLAQFEFLLGRRAHERARLPSMPQRWETLAVHLYGYETLGLEFAKLLADIRPDLSSILDDECRHVGFFEQEIRHILSLETDAAEQARRSARAWRKKLSRTLDRYLEHETLEPFRRELTRRIESAIEDRFLRVGLMQEPTPDRSP
ncbi:MAG: hypothetical protein NNA20_00240 [Nitrospira sp.]|nr:hypothetical protein [Nitrospira sp.]MCP9440997.1 hypothetical protein [Nitrospira sp.]